MRHVYSLFAVGIVSVVLAACSSAPATSHFGPGPAGKNSGGSSSGGDNSGAPNGGFGSGGGDNSGGDNGGQTMGGGGGTTGQVDKTAACDTGLAVDGVAADFAKALGICTSADKDGYGLVSATYTRAFGSTKAPHSGQWGLLPKFGSAITPREGATLAVISSGYAREYNNAGGTESDITGSAFVRGDGFDLDGSSYPTGAAPPGFPKAAAGCAQDNVINDMIDVKLTLKAPMDATGFKFDFDFYSSEWPNFVCSNFNDAFVAYVTSQKLTDNVSFDAKNNPVAVNNDYFDRCTPNTPVACLRDNTAPEGPLSESSCMGGPGELDGTGFAFTDKTQCTSGNKTATLGGATGWLSTQAPIQPGETFTLELMIWDAGDGALDSSVLLDNFQWTGGAGTPPPAPSTTRVN